MNSKQKQVVFIAKLLLTIFLLFTYLWMLSNIGKPSNHGHVLWYIVGSVCSLAGVGFMLFSMEKREHSEADSNEYLYSIEQLYSLLIQGYGVATKVMTDRNEALYLTENNQLRVVKPGNPDGLAYMPWEPVIDDLDTPCWRIVK